MILFGGRQLPTQRSSDPAWARPRVSDSTRRIGLLRWTTCATPAYLERHGVPLHPTDIERDGHVVVGYFSALSNRTMPLRFAKDGEVIEIEPRKGRE
jgi:hypothetical protein